MVWVCVGLESDEAKENLQILGSNKWSPSHCMGCMMTMSTMPGLTTTQKHCTTSILTSPAFPTLDELASNIALVYAIDAPSRSQVVGIVCMVDEIKVKETLDWCPPTSKILGLCHEHSPPIAHVFYNLDDMHGIFNDPG